MGFINKTGLVAVGLTLCLAQGGFIHAFLPKAKAVWPFKEMTKKTATSTQTATKPQPEATAAESRPEKTTTVSLSSKAIEEKAVRLAVSKVLQASNAHNIKTLLSYYSPQFVSGDRMDLKTIRAMIEETWQMYPDIRYQTKILQVRLNGNWATVETEDQSEATAKTAKAEAQTSSEQSGQLLSRSRTLMFWHKVGNRWVVESDATLYEEATMRFGATQTMDLSLVAPDQVFSGEGYTAKVSLPLQEGSYAIAAINREPITFPHKKLEESYRTLTEGKPDLERVFDANTSNRNELVSATLGLIQVVRDEQQRPQVRLNGLATLVKRVNVLPQLNAEQVEKDVQELVRTSANGKFDLTEQAASERNRRLETLMNDSTSPEVPAIEPDTAPTTEKDSKTTKPSLKKGKTGKPSAPAVKPVEPTTPPPAVSPLPTPEKNKD